MKTAGLRLSNPWLKRIMSKEVSTYEIEGEADLDVEITDIFLVHGSRYENYRPQLYIAGDLKGLKPFGQRSFGNDITYVEFGGEDGEKVSVNAFYAFSDEQLVTLVEKGYFYDGFNAPEGLVGQVMQIPATYTGVVVEPEAEGDIPLVFVDIPDVNGLEIDGVTSGYDLAQYYPDYIEALHERQMSEDKELDDALVRTEQREGRLDKEHDVLANFDPGEKEIHSEEEEAAAEVKEDVVVDEQGQVLPTVDTPLFDNIVKSMGLDDEFKDKTMDEESHVETSVEVDLDELADLNEMAVEEADSDTDEVDNELTEDDIEFDNALDKILDPKREAESKRRAKHLREAYKQQQESIKEESAPSTSDDTIRYYDEDDGPDFG